MVDGIGDASLAQAGAFVVVGGSGGIGSAIARRLALRGAVLVLAAREQVRLEQVAGSLGAACEPIDATDFDAVERLLKGAAERFGRVAGVVNAVGSIILKPAHLTSRDDFHETIARNLTTAFAVVRAAGKVMTDGGSVVLFSTVAAQVGLPNHDAIAAAKGGVSALARSCAATYASRGLRVNAIAPGLVDTPLAARLTANPRSLEASRAMHPLGRIGTVDDIAAAACWLLDPATSWVTGQVLSVDGGLSTVRGMA